MEHEEYNMDTNPYPSFGKKYNGEKAIISMTSWAARISTCSKTIFSLLKQCPGFHIVLVLSEEEFPKMMDELPDNLKLFVENELIEVLWVYKNYRSFKKWIFTANKYPNIPIITADDGCVYIRNYAEELYQKWVNQKLSIICNSKFKINNIYFGGTGFGCIFPPKFLNIIPFKLIDIFLYCNNDDYFYGVMANKLKINTIFISSSNTFINDKKDENYSLTNWRKNRRITYPV